MSKIDEKIMNNIKMLSLDMIDRAGSGDAGIVFAGVNVFYSLFMNHLVYDPNDTSFINKDRLVVTNRLLPLLYSCHYLFYNDLALDDLKDYKAYDNPLSGIGRKNKINDVGSLINSDVSASAVGISLGREYLTSLLAIENTKVKLINFKTYCIVTLDELMSGYAYEAMSFASTQNLNNLIFIVIKDEVAKDSSNKETFQEDLIDRFMSLNFNVEEVNDNLKAINGALEDAKNSKKPAVIIVKSVYGKTSSIENSNRYYNKPLSKEELESLRSSYNISSSFTVSSEITNEIKKNINKRLSKYLINYETAKQNALNDLKIKEIIDFLTKGEVNAEIEPDHIKIDALYEEELLKSHNKILNLVAKKSPFVLCISDDNFIYTLASINKSNLLTSTNRIGRNILLGSRTLILGGIAVGLASLGFKVFVSTPLINESILKNSIRLGALDNLDIHFIFTADTFINPYLGNEFTPESEINDLRNINNLIVYRPCDIEEIIGTYNTLLKMKKTTSIILGNNVTSKLKGTNEKYVMAGAYRVKKEESGILDGIIIATGSEVPLALRIAQELKSYQVNLRIVSMPSSSLFEYQSARYQNMLLPKDVKTFTLEFGNPSYLARYATSKDYTFGINSYFTSGTKEEKLNYFDLNLDAIKAKILELLKN